MDRVFSVDDIPGQFLWSSPPPPHHADDPKMIRSASVWAFQRFLQEAAAADSSVSDDTTTTSSSKSVGGGNDAAENKNAELGKGLSVPVDPDEYQEFLKARLDLACAAVALTKAPFVIGQSSAAVAESTSQGSADSQLITQAPGKGSEYKDAGGPIGIPSLPAMPKKIVAQTKTTTSGSQEQSDDDEAESENETPDNDVKRVRRMLSNRESARRSRRRKQEYLTELETEVSQLRVEKSSLLKRLTDISQKYNEAAVDNRVLKADVETLRAKVKMAEEIVKRVTGMNPLLQAMPEISTMRTPAYSGSPSDSADAAVPVHNLKQHLYQPPVRANPISTPIPRVETSVTPVIASPEHMLANPVGSVAGVNKMGRTPSMQRVASLEHLQKRICGRVNQSSSQYSSDL